MTRIEIRDLANNGKVLGEHTTENVISICESYNYHEVIFGAGADGRTYAVIPAKFYAIRDVTINKPRDLVMVTVEPIPPK